MSRLNLLKSKEEELISESELCNSLIQRVLEKINISIKQLEVQDSKSEFRSLYLSTLCLTDKLNEKLVEINLHLEDFIQNNEFDIVLENTPDKNLSRYNINPDTTKSNCSFKKEKLSNEYTPPRVVNSVSKIEKFNSSSKNKNFKFEKNIVEDSDEDVHICKTPATLLPDRSAKSTKTSDKKSNINKKRLFVRASENPEIFSLPYNEDVNTYHRKDNQVSIVNKFSDSTQSTDRENICHKNVQNICHKTYVDTGGHKNAREIYKRNEIQLNDQASYDPSEISTRKVIEYLTTSNKRWRRGRTSEQRRAIDMGPPGFKKSSITSLSTNDESKNLNLIPTTDSYDSYESDRNFEESLQDKDLNTEKQLNNCKGVNPVDFVEEIPMRDCDEQIQNEIEQTTIAEVEKCQEVSVSLAEEPVSNINQEVSVASSEVQLYGVVDLPKVAVVCDDRCIVTHAESPSCFYIITATATENINDYDSFHEELQAYCGSNKARKFSNKHEIKASKANYYCCFNEVQDYNYNWFRCKIIDWLSDDDECKNKVRVLAVDDGFESNVSIDQLRDYSQMKYLLPEMAIKCRLRNLYPPNSTKDHILPQWPQSSVEFFNELIQDSRINPFYVTDVHQLPECYEVDLCNNRRISLSNVMIQMNYAVIIEPNILGLDSDYTLVESDFMKEQIKQAQGFNTQENPLDNFDDCKENLTAAICDHLEGGYHPTDYSRLCKFTKIDGQKCFKGDHCQFEHRLPNPDGWTTDKIEAFATTNQIEVPKIGDRLVVLVTFVKTVCRFYGHIKLPKQKKQMYSASNIIHTASQFTRYINESENIKNLKKFKILPANGQLVIARSPNDDKWYRARIINIYSEDEFEVFFIDYGDKWTVQFNDLREIKLEHLGLPEQAVEFRLARIDPIDVNNVEYMFEAANHLAERILDRLLTVHVINNEHPIEVDVYIDDDVNIANYLKTVDLVKDQNASWLPKIGGIGLE